MQFALPSFNKEDGRTILQDYVKHPETSTGPKYKKKQKQVKDKHFNTAYLEAFWDAISKKTTKHLTLHLN